MNGFLRVGKKVKRNTKRSKGVMASEERSDLHSLVITGRNTTWWPKTRLDITTDQKTDQLREIMPHFTGDVIENAQLDQHPYTHTNRLINTNSLIHLPTHSLAHVHTHTLTHARIHLSTHSLTHLPTHRHMHNESHTHIKAHKIYPRT